MADDAGTTRPLTPAEVADVFARGLQTIDPAAYAKLHTFQDPKRKLVQYLVTKTNGHPDANDSLPGQHVWVAQNIGFKPDTNHVRVEYGAKPKSTFG